MQLDKELLLQMYRDMVVGRVFEQRVEHFTNTGVISGAIHLGIGEEATCVGACRAISAEDYLIPTYRGHVADLVKGSDPRRLLAEILGKATGYCSGRSGSYHIADISSNNLGVQAVLGAQFPIAVGAALTQKRRSTRRIVLTFFGDGTTNEGAFHEGMNLSSVWRLPVVWLCVNNSYAMSTRYETVSAAKNVADRASAYDMPSCIVDGNDVVAVYQAVSQARERARAGEGPTLIESKTYRHRGHSTFDKNLYRAQEEIDSWMSRDPILLFEKDLREEGIIDDAMIQQIASEVEQQIADAESYALNSPEPPPEPGVELVFCPSEAK